MSTNMQLEEALTLVRAAGYRVKARTGQSPDKVYIIRHHLASRGKKWCYVVRQCRKSILDNTYGHDAQILEVSTKTGKWKPLN